MKIERFWIGRVVLVESLSFQELVESFIKNGLRNSKRSSSTKQEYIPESDPSPTSLRLPPDVKKFYEIQAEALGISLHQTILIALRGIKENTTRSPESIVLLIRERFLSVFREHGINYPGMVSLLRPFGFTLAILRDESRLLEFISKQVIEYVAECFQLNPSWLGAEDNQSAWPKSACRIDWMEDVRRLVQFSKEGKFPKIHFVRSKTAGFPGAFEKENDIEAEKTAIILENTEKAGEGIFFPVFQKWDFGNWNDKNFRTYAKQIIYFCKHYKEFGIHDLNVVCIGDTVSAENLESLESGDVLPASILFHGKRESGWFPEDDLSEGDEGSLETVQLSTVLESFKEIHFDRISDGSIQSQGRKRPTLRELMEQRNEEKFGKSHVPSA